MCVLQCTCNTRMNSVAVPPCLATYLIVIAFFPILLTLPRTAENDDSRDSPLARMSIGYIYRMHKYLREERYNLYLLQ